MNKYRLDVNPSSYYAAQLRRESIEIVPYRPAGSLPTKPGVYLAERPEQGVITIKGPVDFVVCLPSTGGLIKDGDIETAREVLDQIAEMDAEARTLDDGEDYEEELAYVEIAADEVRFHYIANACNTEWDIDFQRRRDGAWTCYFAE
jgi:hypothetical protein